jgi:Cysteine sulfinate desulfinase/cysteine desulfurase and related enzymes
MLYFDYAAETPANKAVLDTFYEVSQTYIANPNSTHKLGRESLSRLNEATGQIANMLQVQENEIIYTSGASESNNLALKGIAGAYKKYGKHIITTYLEHSSVTGAITALQNTGYEVDFVDIQPNGLVDLEHLKELLREDTILVSICHVDSEIGITQDIQAIGTILSEYPHCYFHVDGTQAVGKIPVSLAKVDLYTFAPHKFYGVSGCGILFKRDGIMLEPQIHGGISTTPFRSGTPMLALIVAAQKAMELAWNHMEEQISYVQQLNQRLRMALSKYPKITINSTENSVPYILNISIKGINTQQFQKALEEQEVYVSTKSACCATNTPSRPVYAITKDRKAALATLRISLSYLTTEDEVDQLLTIFDQCYKQMV